MIWTYPLKGLIIACQAIAMSGLLPGKELKDLYTVIQLLQYCKNATDLKLLLFHTVKPLLLTIAKFTGLGLVASAVTLVEALLLIL